MTFVAHRVPSAGMLGLVVVLGSGCISSQSGRVLDRSYDAASVRLRPTEPAADNVDLSGPLERDVVVSLAVRKSPALAVMAHRARALVYAGRAEGALPPPELGLEVWNLPLTRPYALGDADMYMVEIRQRFPAAGSLDARARAMGEEAEAMVLELSGEERLVAQRASDAFTDYAQAIQERRLQNAQLALLSRMSDAVHARQTTGGTMLADSTRVDVEKAKPERALVRIEGDIARARATLNALLRRPADAALGEPAEQPAQTISLTTSELLTRAQAHRPAIASAEARERAARARRDAAEAEALIPEFMVGLGYWQDPRMRPGVGVNVSMTLPWLRGPGRPRAEQAKEEEAAAHAARDVASVEAQADITAARAQLDVLAAQLRVVRQQSLPAARRSQDAIAAAFSTGGVSLLEWVDVTRSTLELEMEIVSLEGDLTRSASALERVVGERLPKTAIEIGATP